ncbi:hypothetical protein K488DRAFT_48935 [Vararia minispora EC-137]|uniref:Uncharacterized protein n=1 Tax=Vararia minispora EC-137 TaxID=1314806 RepID=A0ACB8QN89_9AGAM|nr:hypothetical protein K488DRAFT_48935 [Vararia minispora EC-137]
MQEMIINAHVAYKANRIFTMYNYTWNKYTREDYATFGSGVHQATVPARIPITALVGGPIAGGPFPAHDWRPPAVTTEFFEEVCPNPTTLNVGELKGDLQWSSASTILGGVAARLNAIPDNCVELIDETGQIFDFWCVIFGDGARMADAWPQLLESPILTEWRWSDLVRSGLERNRRLIHPSIFLNDQRHRGELSGLLALHIRRGDFHYHCENLANWRSQYNAFNVRPDFTDKHDPPPGGGNGEHTEETLAYWNHHCFPEIDEIVTRVEAVRGDAMKQGRTLDRIYILTNGSKEWLADLKRALEKAAKWKRIATSRDLELTREQKYVAQAIDQIVATRAEVFIGNAWSSLTSNVNLLRIAQFHDPETSRFW